MAAQVSAAASGSAATGALGMAAFALGTAPLMVAFGTAGSLIPIAWKQRMMTVLAVFVIIFGLVFINRGLMLTGAPVNFNMVKNAVVGTQVADSGQYQTGADGVVEVPLVIENTQFVPSTVAIPADKPVRLVVDRREANACSDQLALPQLGVLADLAPNAVTTVDVPATKAGAYTLTCGMGMMSGQLSVGGGASSGTSPLLWLLVAFVAAGGALYVARRREQRETGPAAPGAARPDSATAATSAGVLGFKPLEIVLIVAAVGLAVVAGLVIGGTFS